MTKIFIFLFSFIALSAHARLAPLPKSNIAFYIPHIIDHRYVGLEFGFITKKKLKRYPYNAFVKAFLIEESPTTNDLRAAGLGAKAGLILPTQPWVPIYFELAFGYAKAILHESPWIGKREDTVESSRLVLFEAGIIVAIKKKYLFKMTYQINTVDYFKQEAYFAVGVNF